MLSCSRGGLAFPKWRLPGAASLSCGWLSVLARRWGLMLLSPWVPVGCSDPECFVSLRVKKKKKMDREASYWLKERHSSLFTNTGFIDPVIEEGEALCHCAGIYISCSLLGDFCRQIDRIVRSDRLDPQSARIFIFRKWNIHGNIFLRADATRGCLHWRNMLKKLFLPKTRKEFVKSLIQF